MSPILEREGPLAQLVATFEQARTGRGVCALLSGEGGIGKTALLGELIKTIKTRYPATHVLVGACDALDTPRPLGPLMDIAEQLGPEVRRLLDGSSRSPKLFEAVLSMLSSGRDARLLVFEDVHWADESTRDLIRFLARRIDTRCVLMVVTYRLEGTSENNALRILLGDLKGPHVARIALLPLSEGAVRKLTVDAQTKAATSDGSQPSHTISDCKAIYKLTGGNPFFVIELLRDPTSAFPSSIKDVVAAQLLRLPPEDQRLTRIVSLSPQRCRIHFLAAAFPEEFSCNVVDGSFERNELLVRDAQTVGFKHELSRLAVSEDLVRTQPNAARTWHHQFLMCLEARDGEPLAVLAHHATGTEDPSLIIKWALPAGLEALRLGANREAMKLLGEVLAASEKVDAHATDRMVILEHFASACQAAVDLSMALKARQEAIQECVKRQCVVREGHNLALLGQVYWLLGDRQSAIEAYSRALERLEPHRETAEYAWACALAAGAYMTAEEDAMAIELATRAIASADASGAIEVRVHALNTLGDAQQYRSADWRSKIEQSLSLALEHGYTSQVARAYINLACTGIVAQDYAVARNALHMGLKYTSDLDLDFQHDYLLAWKARERFETGDWNEAENLAAGLISRPHTAPAARIPALGTMASLAVRRGDKVCAELLQRALSESVRTGEHQRIAPVSLSQCEAAWVSCDFEACAGLARVGVAASLKHGSLDNFGRFVVWLGRAGHPGEALSLLDQEPRCPARFVAELRGNSIDAAKEWADRHCHFEQALALSSGTAADVRVAVQLLTELGALPALAMVRRLRPMRGTPPGPRLMTRNDPDGLTSKEREVLALIAEGLSNERIARRLNRSRRTVENHVSALLEKMGATSRSEAAVMARRRELPPQK